jgi:RHS repeat-associated protein
VRLWLDSDSGLPTSQLQGQVYWQADSYDVSGRVDGETYGNGLANDRVYSDATGRLTRATIDRGANLSGPFLVQDLNYTYDNVGNVVRRHDLTPGFVRDEQFYTSTPGDGYDGLDRLKVHRIVGGATVTVAYDQKGNITSKSDVGAYSYAGPGPHAVTAAGSFTYTYDANGNMLAGANRTHTWTSFNQLRKVTTGTLSSEFFFDAAHQRVKQVRKNGATTTDVTFYIGALYEKVVAGSTTEHKHYIFSPTGRVAVFTDRSTLVKDTRYFHTDGLGSITVVSDEKGAVLKRYAYDAWGKQSTLYTTSTSTLNLNPTTRGFTDHEMLADHNLIHMNGRVYDPVLGRFISADPNIDGADDAQGYNRYSYVGNNPLGATDPTGYFKLKDGLKIAAIVVAGIVTAGAAVWVVGVLGGQALTFATALQAVAGANLTFAGAIVAGAGAGFGSGFAGSLLNGGSLGDAFKAGAIGAVLGGITGGLTHGIGTLAQGLKIEGSVAHHAAHGLVQGAANEAASGEFGHGFYSGFFSSYAAGPIARTIGGGAPGQTIAAAIVGGTVSALGGGKFANGAISGAMTYLFNHAAHKKGDYEAYYLVDTDSVFGNGHSAVLLVDAGGKVVYASFSPGKDALTTSDNIDIREYDSLTKARGELLKLRYHNLGPKSEYDRYIKWTISKSQYGAALAHLLYSEVLPAPGYCLKGSNCDDFSQRVLKAAGIKLNGGFTPNITLERNDVWSKQVKLRGLPW